MIKFNSFGYMNKSKRILEEDKKFIWIQEYKILLIHVLELGFLA